jgi:hypothetical protein
MRKKPGYHEMSFYLSDEQYEQLERYWRFHTKEQYITNAAVSLLMEALAEREESTAPNKENPKSEK